MDDHGKSSLGLEEGLVASGAYLFCMGLVLFFLEKKSHFVRFHSAQSILGFSIIASLYFLIKYVEALSILYWIPGLSALAFTGFMMLKAYYGEEYYLPVIGKIACKMVYDTKYESATAEDLLAETESPAAETTTEKK